MALTEIGARLRLAGAPAFRNDANRSATSLAALARQANSADRNLGQMERAARSAGRGLVGMGQGVGKAGLKIGGLVASLGKAGLVGAVAGVGVVLPLVGKSLLDTASSLEALDQKSKTVFGKALPGVAKWAGISASKMGLSKNQAIGLASSFGDLLIPMGFTRDRAAELSTETLNLAGALSQWSGGTTSAAEVADILTSAMLGETDSLKSLGISISAAEIDARLLSKGQNKLTGSALEQAKAVATQALILAKSTDAQDAYAKGGLKLASIQARLKASFQTTREELARRAAPFLLRVLQAFEAKLPSIQAAVNNFARGAIPLLRKAFEGLLEKLPAIQKGLGDFARGALPGIRDGLREFGESMVRIKARAEGLLSINGKAQSAGEVIGKLVGGLVEFAGKAAEIWVSVQAGLYGFLRSSLDVISTMSASLAQIFAKMSGLPGGLGKGFGEVAVGLAQVAAQTAKAGIALDNLTKPRTLDVGLNVTGTDRLRDEALLNRPGGPGRAPQIPMPANGNRRALGGPVTAGQRYLVGETQPEIFVPNVSGQIRTPRQFAAEQSAAGAGGSTTLVVQLVRPSGKVESETIINSMEDRMARR